MAEELDMKDKKVAGAVSGENCSCGCGHVHSSEEHAASCCGHDHQHDADAEHASQARFDDGFAQLASVPFHADREAAPCHQAAYASIAPHVGEGGQQVDCSVMALQQHFGHSCGVSEVPVDLEGRVCVEQVGIGSSFGIFLLHCIARKQFEHVADDSVGMVAVQHTCPEVDFPSDAPSRGHVAALEQGVLCGLEE